MIICRSNLSLIDLAFFFVEPDKCDILDVIELIDPAEPCYNAIIKRLLIYIRDYETGEIGVTLLEWYPSLDMEGLCEGPLYINDLLRMSRDQVEKSDELLIAAEFWGLSNFHIAKLAILFAPTLEPELAN